MFLPNGNLKADFYLSFNNLNFNLVISFENRASVGCFVDRNATM